MLYLQKVILMHLKKFVIYIMYTFLEKLPLRVSCLDVIGGNCCTGNACYPTSSILGTGPVI